MVETYKYKSKIATAISFIAALIAYLGKDGLTAIMPPEYANLVPIIVFIAGYIVTQTTENKRVDIAEQMVYEKIAQENQDVTPETYDTDIFDNDAPKQTEDEIIGDEDDCC